MFFINLYAKATNPDPSTNFWEIVINIRYSFVYIVVSNSLSVARVIYSHLYAAKQYFLTPIKSQFTPKLSNYMHFHAQFKNTIKPLKD